MNYPQLVLPRFCKTPITVTVHQEGVSEDGEPLVAFTADLFCNYQDSVKTVLTEQKKLVQITGSAYFVGDIAPELATLSGGFVEIFGVKRRIESSRKARNPDGTVNYTQLGLE
ncbi:hypothetical protein F9856_06410 [Streptococcus suis]|uniref:hypothetical protein n=1 Tax=Streptococcus suis TaxID=1307 RepID=UPI0019245524|nr:hypothetical protein [Streptococcus suis]MBL1125774.1 hypothetical protein [Streptococcus suis]MCK3937158.1 hypothetical protein [Streptococcus suis]MCK3937239.1 hypothetical protein [Streptococcus suis]